MPDQQLTDREAFRAMALFLREFFDRTGGDFVTLLTDIQIEPDGITTDPAAWSDWVRCVNSVLAAG